MKKYLLVGLTGSIATGKSTVSSMFRALGSEIIDADLLAREVVEPGEPALAQIADEFGRDVLQPDGTLDRKKLSAIIFADPARRKRLEQITHPAIRDRFTRRLDELEARGFAGIVFYDAPVLIEAGGHKAMEKLVVVAADEATQRARLCARDAIGEAEARRKIGSQMVVIGVKRHGLAVCAYRAAIRAIEAIRSQEIGVGQQVHYALAHFRGGLVGERHRQNGRRRHMLRRDDMGDAMRDYPGFTAAGTREN